MDGVNQYYCSNCDRKSNAKRMTKLTSLPPVLNLQLLRFTYDANTMHKKKLTNKIKFSENLDLNAFTKTSATIKTEENASNIYSLGAILMHVGKTAYSGHYMAQIKNFEKNKWLQFNDEVITELKKKQQLGCTDEESEKASTSKEKVSVAWISLLSYCALKISFY
jgi:ubiquitin carboxyl-terminal hydrolase 48